MAEADDVTEADHIRCRAAGRPIWAIEDCFRRFELDALAAPWRADPESWWDYVLLPGLVPVELWDHVLHETDRATCRRRTLHLGDQGEARS